jgi:hypothetical protein
MTFPAPVGLAAIKKTYGDFAYRPKPGGMIQIEGDWQARNIVLVPNVCGTGHSIQLHRLVVPLFQEALTAALAACPDYRVRLLAGFCSRQMRELDPAKQATAPLSVHAWGAAFDLNWDRNPFGWTLHTDLPPAFIAAFTSRGWSWGGAWQHKKDPMHLQFASGY